MFRVSFRILLVTWLSIVACQAQQKVVIDGRYTLSYLLPSGEQAIVGYLTLNSRNYGFEFEPNYKKNDRPYPPFCVKNPSGKFVSSYSAGVSETTDLKALPNQSTIFHVQLLANEKEIYQSLIKLNKEKNSLYFHSEGSGVQMWSLERPNTSKDVFIKSCQQECATSSLRYKSNIDGGSVDQCALIKHYAEMIFNDSGNAYGAKLILKDVCPQTVNFVK